MDSSTTYRRLVLSQRSILSSCIRKNYSYHDRLTQRRCKRGRMWSAFDSALLREKAIVLQGVPLHHGQHHEAINLFIHTLEFLVRGPVNNSKDHEAQQTSSSIPRSFWFVAR